MLLLQPGLKAQDANGKYPQADIEYGLQVYTAQCSTCHGPNGDGVPGVNMRSGKLPRAPNDQELRTVITSGIAGTGMPAFVLDPGEMTGVIAYVRSMGSFDAGSVTMGDEARGKILFEGKGQCATCHRINGKGPRVAPDLSDVGANRTADLLKQTLLDPTAAMMPINRSVHAVTRDGKVINGRRLNEDTYTVQLIDDKENLVSLEKANLREYTVIKTSSMPSYKDKLNTQEIADLMAYLFSLKGLK
jgi:putative heme-binding domain-containing protein